MDGFFNAARDGKIAKIRALVEGKTPEYIGTLIHTRVNGATPMVIASKNGHAEIVDFLVTKCKCDIEEVGNVQFDGETIEGAPPLWCAAAAGHFEVVKILLKNGANVNSTTKTKSTPLRAACYDGHLEIVQFLVRHGADIEIANRHGHTCLMIACYKGHFKIARYLIQNGADVNRKSIKGNTALHDTAESGSLEIMELLLSHQAKMETDSYGVTPLIAASLTGHSHIVELIISVTTCSRQEKVDALELLGATYVDKKRDMMGALEYWRRAIAERSQEPELSKGPLTAVVAYDHAIEVTTQVQLDEVFSDPDAMRMQALLVRERILGAAHPDTSYYIRYRGAVYADTGSFDKCIKLWMYALSMQQKSLDPVNPMVISSLLSFAELFSFMMSKSITTVKFADLFAVFNCALCELQNSIIVARGKPSDEQSPHNFHRTLIIVLHLIGLLCRLQRFLQPDENFELKRAVYRLMRLNVRGRNNRTPLQLACYRDTACHSVRFPLCDFPVPDIVRLFLECGASPHETDDDGNTALHLAALYKQPSIDIMTLLLEHSAHLDTKNKAGETPLDLLNSNPHRLLDSSPTPIYPLRYLTLQCLAARAIVRYNICYEGVVGQCLEKVIKEH